MARAVDGAVAILKVRLILTPDNSRARALGSPADSPRELGLSLLLPDNNSEMPWKGVALQVKSRAKLSPRMHRSYKARIATELHETQVSKYL